MNSIYFYFKPFLTCGPQHYRIYEGVLGMYALRSNLFHFHAVFCNNFCRIIDWCTPSPRVATPPLRNLGSAFDINHHFVNVSGLLVVFQPFMSLQIFNTNLIEEPVLPISSSGTIMPDTNVLQISQILRCTQLVHHSSTSSKALKHILLSVRPRFTLNVRVKVVMLLAISLGISCSDFLIN